MIYDIRTARCCVGFLLNNLLGVIVRYSLKQLAVFDAIADTGSVSKASENLALTQSATSMSLAQLEKNVRAPVV